MPMYCFSCEQCKHFNSKSCDCGYELNVYDDMYDCMGFEDTDPLGIGRENYNDGKRIDRTD